MQVCDGCFFMLTIFFHNFFLKKNSNEIFSICLQNRMYLMQSRRWINQPQVQIHIAIWSISMKHCWKSIIQHSAEIDQMKPPQLVHCMMNWRLTTSACQIQTKKSTKTANRTMKAWHQPQPVQSERSIYEHQPTFQRQKLPAPDFPMKSATNAHKPKRHSYARSLMVMTSSAFMMKPVQLIHGFVIAPSEYNAPNIMI